MLYLGDKFTPAGKNIHTAQFFATLAVSSDKIASSIEAELLEHTRGLLAWARRVL
jgi:hypothetical protein